MNRHHLMTEPILYIFHFLYICNILFSSLHNYPNKRLYYFNQSSFYQITPLLKTKQMLQGHQQHDRHKLK